MEKSYSTTKLCYKLLDDKFLDKNGKIKEDLKFKINIPEFNIVNSKIPAKEDEKFDTYLFLPEGENRKGEGGLRTKGYFKFSYKKFNNEWWIVDFNGNKIKQAEIDKEISKDYEELPLITIITVVYNGEKYLEETIQSVINQTYPNVEYLIVDGGSTDGTLDIIKKYEDKIDYWISEKDKGMYEAINKGIFLSLGNIIGLLNSDDILFSRKVIYKLIKFLLNCNCDGVYGNEIDINSNGKILKKIFTHNNIDFEDLLFSKHASFIPHPTLYLKRYIFRRILYDNNYKYAGDYKFLLQVIREFKLQHIDEFIVKFRVHKTSISSSGKIQKEKEKIFNEFGLFKYSFIYQKFKFFLVWAKFKIFNFFKNLRS